MSLNSSHSAGAGYPSIFYRKKHRKSNFFFCRMHKLRKNRVGGGPSYSMSRWPAYVHASMPACRPYRAYKRGHFHRYPLRIPTENVPLYDPAARNYSIVRISAKPVTSNTSLTTSLTFFTTMLPFWFMVFCAQRRTRSPAEEI